MDRTNSARGAVRGGLSDRSVRISRERGPEAGAVRIPHRCIGQTPPAVGLGSDLSDTSVPDSCEAARPDARDRFLAIRAIQEIVSIHCPAESAAAIVATPGPDRPLHCPIRPGGGTHLGPGSGPYFGSETLD